MLLTPPVKSTTWMEPSRRRRTDPGNACLAEGAFFSMEAGHGTPDRAAACSWSAPVTAHEKSRVRESIVAPIDEWREESVERREPRKRFLDVAGWLQFLQERGPWWVLTARNLETTERLVARGNPPKASLPKFLGRECSPFRAIARKTEHFIVPKNFGTAC